MAHQGVIVAPLFTEADTLANGFTLIYLCIRSMLQEQSESGSANENLHNLSGSEDEEQNDKKNSRTSKKGPTLDSWVKKSEKESKGRNKRSRKDDGDVKETEAKKSKSSNPVEESLADTDFNTCEKTTTDGKTWNFKISSWNVAGIRAWLKVRKCLVTKLYRVKDFV
ncbi:hypothetical protein J6590_076656 [Homalodisca vitripennis]|nr:hypothetical protein J6590_076656 [Homalodisca vitripennis]